METVVVTGTVDPLAALDLRVRLASATDALRPLVEVDLTAVESIHVAGTAALIGAARRARRQGGEVRVIPPASAQARRELALASWFPDAAAGPVLP